MVCVFEIHIEGIEVAIVVVVIVPFFFKIRVCVGGVQPRLEGTVGIKIPACQIAYRRVDYFVVVEIGLKLD